MCQPVRKASATARSQEAKKRRGRADLSHTPPTVQSPIDALQQHAVAKVEGAIATWMHALQMMRRLDGEFAVRLTACRTADEAATLCNRWMAHRVDSLSAVQSHLLEIWLTCSPRLLLRQCVGDATELQPKHTRHR